MKLPRCWGEQQLRSLFLRRAQVGYRFKCGFNGNLAGECAGTRQIGRRRGLKGSAYVSGEAPMFMSDLWSLCVASGIWRRMCVMIDWRRVPNLGRIAERKKGLRTGHLLGQTNPTVANSSKANADARGRGTPRPSTLITNQGRREDQHRDQN